MKFKLSEKPLYIQIWIILGIILGGFSSIIVVIMPFVLEHSFTQESYARIEDHQDYIIKYQDVFATENLSSDNESESSRAANFYQEEGYPFPLPPSPSPEGKDSAQPPFSFRMIENVVLDANGTVKKKIGHGKISENFLKEIKENITEQVAESRRYQEKFNNSRLFYVIRRVNLENGNEYLVSYLRGKYRTNLVKETFVKLVITIIFILTISWITSIFIARYLTRPLTKLQKKVKKISRNNWDEPVNLKRRDEIGQLAGTIEWMRKKLVEQNKNQQDFLQQVSHELKTPVMVIKSYVQSIKDGIFPKGNIHDSLDTIEEEAIEMERRVGSLLDLTKIDYLLQQRLNKERVDFADLIEKKVNIFKRRIPALNWELDLQPIVIEVDIDKIDAVLTNILDNQIRYAGRKIRIKISKADKAENESPVLLLQVWNDGPPISSDVMDNLFEKYKKGDNGNFGLGLYLVKVLINLHQGKVWAVNEKNGVSFYISLPLTGDS